MKLKLDSIRRFLRNDNQLEADFSGDLLEIVGIIEEIDNVKMLLDEYPKLHSVLGYWLADYKHKHAMMVAEQERLYGTLDTAFRKKLREGGDRITESSIQSCINSDDTYFNIRNTVINKAKVVEFLQYMMDAVDKDILVQMSVNSRVNTGVQVD